MSAIKTIAIAGASGNVGSQVLKTLLTNPSFALTVLTHSPPGTHNFPASVTVKQVDYSSLESLTSALAGHDAVINASNTYDLAAAKLFVDAAVQAGVDRYIPADYGMDPDNANVASLPVFGLKAEVYSYLKEKVAAGAGAGGRKLSYTLVASGPFLDQNIRYKFLGIDVTAKKAEIFDDGENALSTTTVADVGKATANIVLHLEETRNRVVYVCSRKSITQKRLYELAKEALGGEWTVEKLDVQKRFDEGMSELKAGRFSMAVVQAQLQYAMARKEYCAPWEKDDNELLGLEEISDEEIVKMIQGMV